MKYLILILLFIFLYACSKDDAPIPPSGIWVEQSLRLDTLDFESNRNSLSPNGGYSTLSFKSNPPSYWAISSYYLQSDSIFLRSFVSSFYGFASYKFQMAANQQTFEVSRFYNRNSLPATLTFEKIK